jgi:hypothetical protein
LQPTLVAAELRMRQRKNIGFGFKAILAYVGAAIVSTLVVYFGVSALQESKDKVAVVERTAPDPHVGNIFIPDHKGNCVKTSFDNQSGRMSDVGVVPCVSSLPGNDSLPPNLEGFQKSFRRR